MKVLLYLWILLDFIMISQSQSCNGSLSNSEFNSLEALYNATNGINWNWNETSAASARWTFPADPSTPCNQKWHGINCTINESVCATCCSISSLSLPGFNLIGKLPVELANLTAMHTLNLQLNLITGTLHSELSYLSSMSQLLLNENGLSGSIWSGIGELTSLIQLDLYSNRLVGSIPASIDNLQSLQQFWVGINNLTGTIPSNMGLMTSLKHVNIGLNRLTGSIPSQLGALSLLIQLDLNQNSLSGSIPSELGNCTSLLNLLLHENLLVGSVPQQLFLLPRLLLIFLFENDLTGSIPSSISALLVLQELDLGQNYLTGSIPPSLAVLSSLEVLVLNENLLAGTIPSQLGDITALVGLAVSSNFIHGEIPSAVGRLTRLADLWLDSQFLTGSIPTELGDLCSLKVAYLFENMLEGTIPFELGNLTSLTLLAMDGNSLSGSLDFLGSWNLLQLCWLNNNLFTGPIPDALGKLSLLAQVDFSANRLTGPIPSSLGSTTALVELSLNDNFITGSIPRTLGSFANLQILEWISNFLTGTLPSEIGSLTALQEFALASNYLSGTLPEAYASLGKLIFLNMTTNLFSGQIASLFGNSPASFPALHILDLSKNGITGRLPSQMFSLQSQLQDVILFSNCFSGSLPESICSAPSLRTLILDTLTSSRFCDIRLSPVLRSLFPGTFPRRFLEGSIPECIWQSASLTTLHMSGNGLTDTLGQLTADSALVDVSLANNKIRGSIPISFQTHGRFQQLDLSSNRLSGTLADQFNFSGKVIDSGSVNQSSFLDLTVNRLSGQIPSSLASDLGINVLNGNLFQCRENNKPDSDPDSSKYSCGSSNLNISLIVWFTTFSVVACMCIICFRDKIRRCLSFSEIWSPDAKLKLPALQQFTDVLVYSTVYGSILALLFVALAMVSFISLKSTFLASNYSTHTFQYTWITTVAFLHGLSPVVMVLVFLALSVIALVVTISRIVNSSGVSDASEVMESAHAIPRRITVIQYAILLSILLVHVVVVVVVNVLYVFALLRGLKTGSLLSVQLFLSIFKLQWNRWVCQRAISRLQFLSPSLRLISYAFVAVFTFLVGPVFATFFTDSSCFRYVITSEPQVSSSYEVSLFLCSVQCVNEDCSLSCFYSDGKAQGVTRVSPGWLYSYQCGSSLLVDYIPVLVLSFTMSGILLPALWVCLMNIDFKFFKSYIPLFMMCFFVNDSIRTFEILETSSTLVPNVSPQSISKSVSQTVLDTLFIVRSPGRRLFDSSVILSNVIRNLTVLLTFGLASPLLSICIAVDGLSTIALLRFQMQRYISGVDGLRCLAVWDRFELAARQFERGLWTSLAMAFVFCIGFWCLFVFDMVGDVHGSREASLVVLGTVLTLGAVWVTSVRYFFYGHIPVKSSTDTKIANQQVSAILSQSSRSTDNPLTTASSQWNDNFL